MNNAVRLGSNIDKMAIPCSEIRTFKNVQDSRINIRSTTP
jgi:hypothetical protein